MYSVLRITCVSVLGGTLVIGLAWAQESLADIEFLEFLGNWSQEEQQWLDAEMDAIVAINCEGTGADGTGADDKTAGTTADCSDPNHEQKGAQ